MPNDLFTPNKRGRSVADDIDASGDCWQWIGAVNNFSGYGSKMFDGKNWAAHRLVWTLLIGEIPEGLEIDHMCKNRACVNPDHLRVVTHAENCRRPRKWYCNRGHKLFGENAFIFPSGGRRCRTCKRVPSRW